MRLVTNEFIKFFSTFGYVRQVVYEERSEDGRDFEPGMKGERYDAYFDVTVELLPDHLGMNSFVGMKPFDLYFAKWRLVNATSSLESVDRRDPGIFVVNLHFKGVAIEDLEQN